MTERYGLHGSLRAKRGRGDALAELLLEAAAALNSNTDCMLYLVSRSPDDNDVVLVTEVWTTREAHDSSLQDEAVKALIQRGMPLIVDMPTSTEFLPAGGKGLTA
ncbi:MAG: antibiotic biosynthesis monooxygenase [Acidobacteria bacterium]|nr:antibiotic biosynthesis monooxygenase [Acidobacteriota bacterium]